jgi:hypothetical protein
MPRRAKVTGKKDAAAGKRFPLNMRTTFDVRRHLEESAKASGRSLAQEAEYRIERSFLDQKLMIEALELTYGRELSGILMMLGEAMMMTGRQAGFSATSTLEGSQNWFENGYAFQQAEQAAVAMLEAVRPAGEIIPPTVPKDDGRFDWASYFSHLGAGHAKGLLAEIASAEPTTATERVAMLRRSLGSLVERIKSNMGRKQ